MSWLSINENEIADAVRRIFGPPGAAGGAGIGSLAVAPSPQSAAAPDGSDGGWYDPFPADGRFAVGRSPDLSRGEGIQPLVTGMNGKGYSPQEDDKDLLARIIFSEGAGNDADYPGLAWSVVNRVGARRFPDSLSGVLQQTDRNGNYQLGYDTPLWRASGDPNSLTGKNALSYQKASDIAEGVLNGSIPDPTGGALYFHSGAIPSAVFFPKAIASGRLVQSPQDGYRGAFKFYRDTQE